MKIDTHHHLWDMAVRPQSWMTDKMKTQIEGPYDMGDWEAVAKPQAINFSIAVQTVPVADETLELLAAGLESTSLAGVVGWLDVTDSRFRENLDALCQLPGGNKLVGLRELAEYHPDSEWMASPTMNEVARALGESGLTLDLLVLTHQIPAATKLVEANPNVRFVLDHLAKPSLEPAALVQWSENVRALAHSENVACKVSGYAVFDLPNSPTYARLKPAIDVVLDAFGPNRLMFGSDWPVAELGARYGDVVEIARQFSSGFSTEEQDRFWAGTAIEWYPNVVVSAAE